MHTPEVRMTLRRICTLFLLLLAASLPARAGSSPPAASVLVDGVRIDYRDTGGSGVPLLLITGYAVTLDMWDQDFVRALGQERRLILMDNRGMGGSSAPEGGFGIAAMAGDAAGLLRALGVDRADVLGWSMGGFVAQELALAHPGMVRGLVLLTTQADNAGLIPQLDRMAAMKPEAFQAALFSADWARSHPDVYSRMPARPRPPDLSVIARQYAAMRDWPGAASRLGSLGARALVVAGGEDWVCPPPQAERLARGIAGARFVVLPDGGHWMMHQYPHELARLIGAFLNADGGGADAGARPGVGPGSRR
jgi:pimeloyl-ACP methyl ester carboxylesterase